MDAKPVFILCIYASPREGGNTDRMMDAFVKGAREQGAEVKTVYLRDLNISTCREIYACRIDGNCGLDDDMTPLYPVLRSADAIVMASPVMFYGHGGLAKAFIDRTQSLWCLKYMLNEKVNQGRLQNRRAVLLSAGATKGQKLFDGMQATFRYFLDAIEAKPWGEVFCRGVDDAGEIDRQEGVLEECETLAKKLIVEIKEDLGKIAP